MPVPKPRKGETQKEYIPRCISFLEHEGGRGHEQIQAICFDTWRESKGIKRRAGYVFNAAIHNLGVDPEERLATFYIMNTSKNRIGWGVTDKALEEALPSLLGNSICCGQGYRQGHQYDPMEVGKWVSTSKPNGYALATATISDDHVWAQLEADKWGPISVVIDVYDVHCSDCGESLAGADYREHSCIESGAGYALVESFKFGRVDFVDIPAFPQADMISLNMLAQFYASQSIDGRGSGSLRRDLETRGKKKMEAELAEVNEKLETLEAGLTELKDGFETLKAAVEKPPDDKDDDKKNPELEQVKAELQEIKDRRHAGLVAEALNARTKAGLVPDPAKEAESLAKLDDTALIMMRIDAEAIVEQRERDPPATPKAQYTEDSKTELEAAMATMRTNLRLPAREATNQ